MKKRNNIWKQFVSQNTEDREEFLNTLTLEELAFILSKIDELISRNSVLRQSTNNFRIKELIKKIIIEKITQIRLNRLNDLGI